MSKANLQQALTRQWELLRLLPTHGTGSTAAQLTQTLGHAGYAVSKRTVERDLQLLEHLFPLQCNDRSQPYGWKWMPRMASPFPGISLAEALSLSLAETYLRTLLPEGLLETLTPRFAQAHEKIETLSEQPVTRWLDKVRQVPPHLPRLSPTLAPGVMATVQQALLEDTPIEAEYTSTTQGRQARCLVLHPLGLVQRGPVFYLVATAFEYDDIRLYAVHRIKKAVLTTGTPRCPQGFDLDDYIATGALEFGDGKTLTLKARVRAHLGDMLSEMPLADDQTLKPLDDGDYTLSATLSDSWQLRWWILQQGSDIEILAPRALRAEIAQTLENAAKQYRKE